METKNTTLASAENERLLTVREAAKISGITAHRLSAACSRGAILGASKNEEGLYVFSRSALEAYCAKAVVKPDTAFGNISLKPNEYLRPVTSYDSDIFDPFSYEFLNQIMASNQGRVFNLSTRLELHPVIQSDGRPFVSLPKMVNGAPKYIHVYVSQAVACAFCPISPFRYPGEVHHINKNHADNRASNLIRVSPEEHCELHRLLRAGDKKAYRALLKEIRDDNKRWA